MLKIACDDGSTSVKLAWLENEKIVTHISPNSFKEGWNTEILSNNPVFNYLVDDKKYTFDIGSSSVIETTHVSYQYSALNRLAIHHALLTSGLLPQDIELTVTLPVTEFFTEDAQINEKNIQRKKENILKKVNINKGENFDIVNVMVMPESIPAVREVLIKDNISSLERSLIVDLGGTTLDCAVIQGLLDNISEIKGNSEIGVSKLTKSVINALYLASSPSSYYIADEVIKNVNNMALLKKVINDPKKITHITEVVIEGSKNLADRVISEIEKINNINRIYLTGGGAEIIYSYVNDYFKNHKVEKIFEPQLALVKAIALS
ncbi:plasmid segregation protein ParM domain-containing protein [Arsenophonus sp. PmNCSU2021_1]|uniref:plasmid segregation protein ParM domain-containing protein n=1 Tax=Arsenophonus sp. PmNCSU2021_1 TaxID=3118989 RepID=UPI002FF2D0E0